MKIRTGVRHVREGVKSVFRNGWMSVASISAMSVSLLILGMFLMLATNVNQFTTQLESQVEISVYLELSANASDAAKLEYFIKDQPNVKNVKFISKDEALDFIKSTAKDPTVYDGLNGENNPLNDKFTVEVQDPRNVKQVAEAIEAWNKQKDSSVIELVSYGKEYAEKLFHWTEIVRVVGLVFVLLLGLTSMFLVANTIKLTIIARRREISIMKLVGATNSFIRWPFFVEGAFLGTIGSAIPAGALLYGYYQLEASDSTQLVFGFVKLVPWQTLALPIGGLLLGLGLIIGVWGSIFSVRKYLRV